MCGGGSVTKGIPGAYWSPALASSPVTCMYVVVGTPILLWAPHTHGLTPCIDMPVYATYIASKYTQEITAPFLPGPGNGHSPSVDIGLSIPGTSH